jgi:hypothetical protein
MSQAHGIAFVSHGSKPASFLAFGEALLSGCLDSLAASLDTNIKDVDKAT